MSAPLAHFKEDAKRVAGDLRHRGIIQTAMGEAKCASALETKADYIVSCDSSCLMQIQGLADKQQKGIKTIHLAEVLAQQ